VGGIIHLASPFFLDAKNIEREIFEPAVSGTVSLLPPLVYCPNENFVNSTSSLNTSSANLYRIFSGSIKEIPPTTFPAMVDVRDLARAQLLAYESERAANQRYLISAMSFDNQQIADIIRKSFPKLRDTTPEGDPSKPLPEVFRVDNGKSIRKLGMTNSSLEWTVVDSVKRLEEIKENAL
jgi:nucleoside-diphosphate-sugar epimerase